MNYFKILICFTFCYSNILYANGEKEPSHYGAIVEEQLPFQPEVKRSYFDFNSVTEFAKDIRLSNVNFYYQSNEWGLNLGLDYNDDISLYGLHWQSQGQDAGLPDVYGAGLAYKGLDVYHLTDRQGASFKLDFPVNIPQLPTLAIKVHLRDYIRWSTDAGERWYVHGILSYDVITLDAYRYEHVNMLEGEIARYGLNVSYEEWDATYESDFFIGVGYTLNLLRKTDINFRAYIEHYIGTSKDYGNVYGISVNYAGL